MKRIAWITALLCCMTAEAGAQDWKGLLRGLFGSSDKQTEQPAPEPAPKHLTAQQLVGTWVYAGAVIRYTGEDLLASMAVGVLEGQIEEYCAKAGVVAGRDRVTLDRRGGALVRIDKHEAKGSYRYDPATGSICVEIDIRGKRGTLTGTTEYENGTLTLLFHEGCGTRAGPEREDQDGLGPDRPVPGAEDRRQSDPVSGIANKK